MKLFQSLTPLAIRAITVLALLVLVAGFFGLRSCQSAQVAKTESRLSKGQTGAAMASGADAVETIGKSAAAEAAVDNITRENERAIRQAPGADAPVDPAVHGAGLRSLCRRAANRGKPECLQLAPAK